MSAKSYIFKKTRHDNFIRDALSYNKQYVGSNRFLANKGRLRLAGPLKSSTVRRGPLTPRSLFGTSYKLEANEWIRYIVIIKGYL